MSAMPHEPRLTLALRQLLQTQRVAFLGTLDETGHPFVSMVPFALDPEQGLVIIHVSQLAAHTRYLLAVPQVSLLVVQAEVAGEPVHALPRVTLQGLAKPLPPDSVVWTSARSAYLARFPEAEPMTQFGDFMWVGIAVKTARQVAGFGAARSVDAETLAQVLGSPHAS
jgi:putative heme iron utilization protein